MRPRSVLPIVVFLAGILASVDSRAFTQAAAVEGWIRTPITDPSFAAVYLVSEPQGPAPESGPRIIDQRDLRFVPHILVVWPGQTVEFQNSDPLMHNVFSPNQPAESFDLGTYPMGDKRVHAFHIPGAHVILCHIHPEMVAYVIVAPAAYQTVPDRDGRFRLTNVSPGVYRLHVWHPRAREYFVPLELSAGENVQVIVELERR